MVPLVAKGLAISPKGGWGCLMSPLVWNLRAVAWFHITVSCSSATSCYSFCLVFFLLLHTIPDPWPWINNCLEQWSQHVFQFNWVTLAFTWYGEKVWKNSVQHCWSHSSKANHGSAHALRYDMSKSELALLLIFPPENSSIFLVNR